MIETITLEQLVRKYVTLPAKPTSKGWYSVRCLVCNDHKHKKRGGWRFDGDTVGYHCFNCAIHGSYNPKFDNALSDDLRKILLANGIPVEALQQLAFSKAVLYPSTSTSKKFNKREVDTSVPTIVMPDDFRQLDANNQTDVWSVIANAYLEEERGMSATDYPFFLCDSDKPELAAWNGRLIIPIYKDGRLVMYQGRDLLKTPKPGRTKYKTPKEANKETVVYGFDQLYTQHDDPLYVVEGFFDAYHIGGVAIFGNVCSAQQMKLLNDSPRKKVVIPDRRGDGHLLALQALEQDWCVSFPDIGECKDINEAVTKYGLLYVKKTIEDNTKCGYAAVSAITVYCEHKQTWQKTNTPNQISKF